ncbi:MAG: T9SS type A sorting domain-containing protein [Flavobacteriales bacterium]|nr:T9SS type A sorting domain-containing protein [Flavobacteriales bacterium]MBL0034171.1 T9SS type A sorting domain-containing protein [Flavobacteriales bacterium]
MHAPFLLLAALACGAATAQNFPWERPLLISGSVDGITFDPPTVFQDSSGVPSVVRWHGDTLVAAFQWFRQPNPGPSWDRVAVKFSYDNGASWTAPTPIVVNGLPSSYQRPFDPTLAAFGGDSLRIYFSSSDGMPLMLDSTVNTYSARSADGVHYSFEPGARVDELNERVIDPAVIQFGPGWHYLAPAGAPQDGAFHYVSPDGVGWAAVPTIPSDMQHNWTGNYVVENPNELRFYGAGTNGIWYNSTPNGGQWNGYTNTNVQGGDPSVVKLGVGSYLMVYVGAPYVTGIADPHTTASDITVYPQPASTELTISWPGHAPVRYRLWSATGTCVALASLQGNSVPLGSIGAGLYLLEVVDAQGTTRLVRVLKEN